jgi:hypothetical protein
MTRLRCWGNALRHQQGNDRIGAGQCRPSNPQIAAAICLAIAVAIRLTILANFHASQQTAADPPDPAAAR